MIDDPATNFQYIRCSSTDAMECHNSRRAWCEIMSICGSLGRPVLCECVSTFGFPNPVPLPIVSEINEANGKTFRNHVNRH
jgi:hypothetical protein